MQPTDLRPVLYGQDPTSPPGSVRTGLEGRGSIFGRRHGVIFQWVSDSRDVRSMICVATIPRAAPHPRPAATGVSRAGGLLRRDDLLAALDRASLRKVTVISATP